MDTTKTPERRLVRPAALLAALSALGLTFTLMVGPALADHETDLTLVAVATGEGDECEGFDFAFKLDNIDQIHEGEDNVYTASDADHTVFIEIEFFFNDDDPPEVNDFEILDADPAIADIIIKQPNEGGGISHLTFCYNEEESEEPSVEESVPASVEESVPASVEESVPASVEESVPASVEESVPASVEESVPASVEESTEASIEESTEASVEESVPGSVEGSVLGNTGTPEPSTPDTAFGSDNGPSPLPTIVFGAILLASLAGLAWVNVQAVRTRS